MKQKKISKWLKAIAYFLVVTGTLFVIGVTIFAFINPEKHPVGSIIGFPFFTWYTIVFCYGIMFQFWKVATEIGKDNSFSPENAKSFHKMFIAGIFLAIGFIAKFCLLLFAKNLGLLYGMFIALEIIGSIVLIVLCEALSKLIQNAYEIKQENELTI